MTIEETNKIICVCQNCGKKIEESPKRIASGHGKYCSKKCMYEFKSNKVVIFCSVCGKEFETVPSRIKNGRGKYCSKECFWESEKGRVVTEETRKKLSLSARGRIISEETKTKISQNNKGKHLYLFGRHHTEETKKKLSVVRRTGLTKKCPVCGKLFYIRKSAPKRGKGIYCSKQCYMRGKEPTNIEKATMKALKAMNIKYVYQFQPEGFPKFYDFILIGTKILIEVDGTFWHSSISAKANDKLKTKWAKNNGYTLLRYLEKDITQTGIYALLNKDLNEVNK